MSDPRYILLTIGMVALFLAVLYTCLGKAWNRSNAWIYRAKEPVQYWLVVGAYYLGGVASIIGFLLLTFDRFSK